MRIPLTYDGEQWIDVYINPSYAEVAFLTEYEVLSAIVADWKIIGDTGQVVPYSLEEIPSLSVTTVKKIFDFYPKDVLEAIKSTFL
jgi:hypothetical protein